jgi:hypothetical protein
VLLPWLRVRKRYENDRVQYLRYHCKYEYVVLYSQRRELFFIIPSIGQDTGWSRRGQDWLGRTGQSSYVTYLPTYVVEEAQEIGWPNGTRKGAFFQLPF